MVKPDGKIYFLRKIRSGTMTLTVLRRLVWDSLGFWGEIMHGPLAGKYDLSPMSREEALNLNLYTFTQATDILQAP